MILINKELIDRKKCTTIENSEVIKQAQKEASKAFAHKRDEIIIEQLLKNDDVRTGKVVK